MAEESVITEDMREIARTWRGERYTDTIERGRIRDFADAIGDPNPLWRDPEYARSLGYRDVVAPPTYLYSYTPFYHGVTSPIPRPFKRGFSASDETQTFRPIQAGDTITCTVKIGDLWEKRGRPGVGRMLFIRYEYEFTDQEGELVGRGAWVSVNFEG